MTHTYSQRSLIVLSLLGILSAIMSVLSVTLIFQLHSQRASVKDSPPSTSTLMPAHLWTVLLPVSTVLCALSLTLHLCSVVVCLLHSYFCTEVCRGEQDTDRADWFLLDSRAVRHVAVGLFCLGVSVYLAGKNKTVEPVCVEHLLQNTQGRAENLFLPSRPLLHVLFVHFQYWNFLCLAVKELKPP
ncbi:transmembrane protein 221 [Solea senegalensis]|uniref:Transmembrane protein 221 n=1 Tax=Solea senegalensis TaxID=28829 RepID=A0AAV6S9G0_SOLSE|nr:transmembrane protein 221 [Solea senegalensis]